MARSFTAKITLSVLALSLFPTSIAQAVEQRVVDVVAVSWSGAPAIQDKYQRVVDSIDQSVGPQWLSFTSLEGDARDRKILFYKGRDLPTPISISAPMPCTGYQTSNFMGDVRQEAYRRLGITNFADRYLIIVAPQAGCIWQGRAMLGKPGEKGGVLTLHDNSSSFVIVHELGHSLGLGHSNLLQCDGGARDGNWGRECRAVEYGGAIDVMGNVDTTSPLSIYHQWRIGLLEKEEIKTSWKSEEIELKPSTSYGSIRSVFIKDGGASYWIEYRKARPTDSYKSGLIIYRTDPPPVSAIISPNPEDSIGAEPDSSVTADFWMMNLGDYRYSSGRSSGSMTLSETSSVKLASGNIELTVSSITESALTLKISRKADTTAPPAPVITPPLSWRSPNSLVIDSSYDDLESTLDFFEIERDGVVSKISVGSLASWTPTYLYPLEPRGSLLLSDLPEGNYNLRVRGVDIWGNVSSWSSPEKVIIDRGFPIVTNQTKVLSASPDLLQVQWSGASDRGIGLCETNRSTEEGWVLTQSKERINPVISIPIGKSLTSNFQVVDCRGNSVTGKLSTNAVFTQANSARKTGKWEGIKSPFVGAMRCMGRCTITFSARGNLSILAGQGTADVLVSSKKVGVISQSSSDQVRSAMSLELGKNRKVVRIQGSNFAIHGALALDFLLSASRQENLNERVVDDSLKDALQRELSNFGFSGDDFESGWTVLPMARGTTLLDPTLDLCEFEFKSDQERSARRQMSATKVGSPYIFLSTEVVRYKSESSAQSALAELKANLKRCIAEGGGMNRTGNKTVYQFSPNSLPKYEGIVSDANGVFVHTIIGAGSQARALLGFYQFKGDILSGLYVVSNQGTYFSSSTIEHWSQVAAILGMRLMNKSLA